MDEAIAEPPVKATELSTRVPVMGASTWMSRGTPTRISPRMDSLIPTSNPRCTFLDPNQVNRSFPTMITGTTRGLLTTPREDQGTTSLLETATATIVNVANVASSVTATGSADAATSTRNLIPLVHLLPIPTLLSRPVLKTSPRYKMTSMRVTLSRSEQL